MQRSKVPQDAARERKQPGWQRRLFAGAAAVPVWMVLAFAGWIIAAFVYALVVPQDGADLAVRPKAESLDFAPAAGPARPLREAPQ